MDGDVRGFGELECTFQKEDLVSSMIQNGESIQHFERIWQGAARGSGSGNALSQVVSKNV